MYNVLSFAQGAFICRQMEQEFIDSVSDMLINNADLLTDCNNALLQEALNAVQFNYNVEQCIAIQKACDEHLLQCSDFMTYEIEIFN